MADFGQSPISHFVEPFYNSHNNFNSIIHSLCALQIHESSVFFLRRPPRRAQGNSFSSLLFSSSLFGSRENARLKKKKTKFFSFLFFVSKETKCKYALFVAFSAFSRQPKRLLFFLSFFDFPLNIRAYHTHC